MLLLGLDGAGKTSIINQICVANGDETSYTVPPKSTQGSSMYRVKYGLYTYNIWDSMYILFIHSPLKINTT